MTTDPIREALEPFAKAAERYSGNQDSFELTLPRGPFFGKDDFAPTITVGDLRRARAAISSMPTIAGDEERARIVAWLRNDARGGPGLSPFAHAYADAIEAGKHLQTLSPEHIRRGDDAS